MRSKLFAITLLMTGPAFAANDACGQGPVPVTPAPTQPTPTTTPSPTQPAPTQPSPGGNAQLPANGVFAYGANSAFPTETYQATNYWVEPVGRPLPETYRLFADTDKPATASANDASSVEIGTRFTVSQTIQITGIRFYKGQGNSGKHTGTLWDQAGKSLATATFANETPTGWQSVSFSTPVVARPSYTYTVSYHASQGHYAADQGYFGQHQVVNGPLSTVAGGPANPIALAPHNHAEMLANIYVDPRSRPRPRPQIAAPPPATGH